MRPEEQQLRSLSVSRKHPAQAIHCKRGSEALTLRPLRLGDAAQVLSAVEESLPELKVFMPWAHGDQGLQAQLQRRIATEADYFAGRELNMGLFVDGTLVVCCGLHFRVPLNPNGVECGYWTRTGHARKGWATLVLQMMTLYALDKLACDRVQVLHHEYNVASRRVIEKAGFMFEANLRNVVAAPSAELIAGGHVSSRRSLLWSLVPEDLRSLPWVAPLRERLQFDNMLGHPV